ncbi:glycerol dehydratase reactivase beta/small subunit family protein [Furfurilactobacillus siliginis]|uniref:Propanediol dehydratase n=1 Tax=Furfurilactobacillus siliginis TaxID=348151 RepID=A0A0R2LAV1_9LACO|nr:glycerol dehydratase reactivase beta/small subunit family protein [Furfurilactobacillus siliginis]KRN96218.1 hypothetical protein IV55_GL001604 [Furfurilactobacillus siliginis]GEK27857.1 hypothetical protein LSI01_01680 [Furfurilactobacillus siliginis]
MAVEPKILIAGKSSQSVEPLLNGIEEEEIPYQMTDKVSGENTVELAHEASLASQLHVGLATDDQFAYLHLNSLPVDKPLARVALSDKEDLRRLGANAARLVKRVPFKDFERGGEIL